MMPFARFFNRLFSAELKWLPKLLGAGAVGLAIALTVLWKSPTTFDFVAKVAILIIVPAFSMLAAGALIRADIVQKRLESGGSIGPLSRLFFGLGIWSLLIWIFAALLVGFPLAIWLGSVTSTVSPR